MVAFSFRSTNPDTSFEHAMLVVGFPSSGFVAQVAARHLIASQNLTMAGIFTSDDLAPSVTIVEGCPIAPLRVHVGAQVCGLDQQCSALATLLGDIIIPDELQSDLANAIVAWAEKAGVASIVVLEGMPASEGATEPKISGASSSEKCREMLKAHGIELLDDVVVSGTTAAFLAAGEGSRVEVMALFVEAHNEFRDAAAAASLVESVDKFLLQIPIDAEPLRKQAEQLTAQLRATAQRVGPAGPSMYG